MRCFGDGAAVITGVRVHCAHACGTFPLSAYDLCAPRCEGDRDIDFRTLLDEMAKGWKIG